MAEGIAQPVERDDDQPTGRSVTTDQTMDGMYRQQQQDTPGFERNPQETFEEMLERYAREGRELNREEWIQLLQKYGEEEKVPEEERTMHDWLKKRCWIRKE